MLCILLKDSLGDIISMSRSANKRYPIHEQERYYEQKLEHEHENELWTYF